MEKIIIASVLIAAFIIPYTEQVAFFWEEECPVDGDKWFYVKTFKDDRNDKCTLKGIGYQPKERESGTENFNEVVETQNDFISGITGIGTDAAAIAEKASTGYDAFVNKLTDKSKEILLKLKAAAPKLAASFGILGLGLTLLTAGLSAEQELIDMTTLAFEKMTIKMNKQMDQLKGYTDDKVNELEQSIMKGELKTMESFWANCILEPKVGSILQCQKDVSKLYRASSAKFYVLYDLMKTKPESLDRVHIKRLEVSLIPLRQYVLMNLFVVETLKSSYKNSYGGCSYGYRSCLKASINDMRKFKVYFDWALKHIISVHTRDFKISNKPSQLSYCNGHVTCEKTGGTTYQLPTDDSPEHRYRCGCALDPVSPDTKCYIKHIQYEKPKTRGARDGYDWFCAKSITDFMVKNTTILLKPVGVTYVEEFKDQVGYFWKTYFSYDKIVEVLEKSEETEEKAMLYCDHKKKKKNDV